MNWLLTGHTANGLAILLGVVPAPLVAHAATTAANAPTAIQWIRAGANTNRPLWGVRGGLLWSLPAGRNPSDGPRGLIRLWAPVLTNGGYDLINFIAVEPIVGRRRGFSELERSALDAAPGRRIWATNAGAGASAATDLPPGQLAPLSSGAEELTVHLSVERFDNGAEVRLTVKQRSDAPDEIELVIHARPGSAPMEYCILTATMGNKARARQLWLNDRVVTSLQLYPDYRGDDFTPHHLFPLDRLRRTAAGDVLAAITTDEANPSAVEPFPGKRHWRYDGVPVTQYWKKPAGAWRDDLHVAVNGRFTYWLSRQPIPGGIAFENFEMRERFHEGQRFIFGITRKPPEDVLR